MSRSSSGGRPGTELEPAKETGVLAAMIEASDGPYFASREEDERRLSREAIDWRAIAAHHELADRYEALAAVFGEKRLTKPPIDYL